MVMRNEANDRRPYAFWRKGVRAVDMKKKTTVVCKSEELENRRRLLLSPLLAGWRTRNSSTPAERSAAADQGWPEAREISPAYVMKIVTQ